jgi:hypothetical protein
MRVEREVNLGERGRCRRDKGEIVGHGGRREGWGGERVRESVRGGKSKKKRSGTDRERGRRGRKRGGVERGRVRGREA